MKTCLHEKNVSPFPDEILLRLKDRESGRVDAKNFSEGLLGLSKIQRTIDTRKVWKKMVEKKFVYLLRNFMYITQRAADTENGSYPLFTIPRWCKKFRKKSAKNYGGHYLDCN